MTTLTLFFSGRLLLSLISEPAETEVSTVQQNTSLLVTIMVGDITTLLDLVAVACVVVFLVRYLLAIRARGTRAEYILNGGDRQHLIPYGRGESVFDIAYTSALPKVAFVLPVKFHGVKAQSPKDNWKAQLGSMYKGPMEAIFAVESEDDGAVPVIHELQEELKDKVAVKLAVAGLAGGSPETNHSQKIHNQLAGIKMCSPDCKYILFADVGCRMHPGTLQALVYELETDPRCFVATGYPFDIPPPTATVWAWGLCQFRYMCMSEFLTNRSTFVWGGAMLLRKADLDNNKHNLINHWRYGGYSDDMSVQACAQDHRRCIATPLEAVFANPIRPNISLWDFWDFLHRQNFTLTTYQTRLNQFRHWSLFFLYGFAMLSLTVENFMVCAKLVFFVYDPSQISAHLFSFLLWVTYISMFVLSAFVQHYNLTKVVALINALSPEKEDIDMSHISRWIIFYSNVIHFILGTACMFRNIFCRWVTWRGITYKFKNGRVVEVIHEKS